MDEIEMSVLAMLDGDSVWTTDQMVENLGQPRAVIQTALDALRERACIDGDGNGWSISQYGQREFNEEVERNA